MPRRTMFSKFLWLPLAALAAGSLMIWQLGATPSVEASPPVDERVAALAGAPASFADVIEAVQPAVVNIAVTGMAPASPEAGPMPGLPFEDFEDFLRRFFERQSLPGDAPRGRGAPTFQGMGSGFIVDPEGYVVTNQHVVDHATDVAVTLHDGTRLPATVIGIDSKTDLALLKVETKQELPYARFGDSERTRVGDWVVAIGNPFGLGGSATAGIVSARGRDIRSGPYDDFFQIDAPINRGNSGGPLFDLTGRVIGINTAIYSPNGGNVGIGFAIPSNLAGKVIEDLRNTGRVERGWLGVAIQPVDEEIAESLGLDSAKGALVASVVPQSPAARAGLEPGDVIVGFGGEPVEEVRELTRKVADLSPGERVALEIRRNGERRTLDVRVGQNPDESRAARAEMRESSAGLGLSLGELTPSLRDRFAIADEVSGAVVLAVAPDSGAFEKGLRPGDVIVSVGQTAVENLEKTVAEIERQQSEGRASILLRIVRSGEATFVAVPLS